jgi:hypothetical protein
MKAMSEKCGWVIPKKERRVLKLLRNHTREYEHEFVSKCPSTPRWKPDLKIRVEFAQEELSAFHPTVHILAKSEVLAA